MTSKGPFEASQSVGRGNLEYDRANGGERLDQENEENYEQFDLDPLGRSDESASDGFDSEGELNGSDTEFQGAATEAVSVYNSFARFLPLSCQHKGFKLTSFSEEA